MATRWMREQTLAALLAVTMCGCSAIGMGYRADHSRARGPKEAARLTQLAEMYERQGHPSGAMRLYRQALQSDPRSQEARSRLMALSSQHAAPSRSPVATPPTAAPAGRISPTVTSTAAPLLAGVHARRTAAASPQALARSELSPIKAPPLAPEPPTSGVPAPLPIASVPTAPIPSNDAPQARPLPTIELPTAMPLRNVAESAAAAAMASAAAPFRLSSPASRPEAAPLIHPAPMPVVEIQPPPPSLAPTTQAMETAQSLLETPATATITALPTLSTEAPEMVATNPGVERGWTTSRAEGDARPAVVSEPAPRLDLEIHPQQAPSLATVPLSEPATWAPTDLQRLSPGAGDELLSLVRRLSSPDALVRKDALIELLEDAETAQPALAAIRTLQQDPDVAVRAHAAWAVCCVGGPEAESVAVLSRVLEAGETAAAPFAAFCLGQLAGDAAPAIPVVRQACGSDSAAVRLCAAEALLKITPDDAEPVSVLIEGLRSPDAQLRWLAALSLSAASRTYQDSAILALIPVLQDEQAVVCSSAALALGAYGPQALDAVPALQAALSHPDVDVRDAATAALACIEVHGE